LHGCKLHAAGHHLLNIGEIKLWQAWQTQHSGICGEVCEESAEVHLLFLQKQIRMNVDCYK